MCLLWYIANAAAGGPPLVSAQQLSGVVGMPAMQGTLLAIIIYRFSDTCR